MRFRAWRASDRPVLLAKDLAAAREVFHDKLGLQIERENENAIAFRCGEEFLAGVHAGVHVGVLSAAIGTAGQTLAVPVWYRYQ